MTDDDSHDTYNNNVYILEDKVIIFVESELIHSYYVIFMATENYMGSRKLTAGILFSVVS